MEKNDETLNLRKFQSSPFLNKFIVTLRNGFWRENPIKSVTFISLNVGDKEVVE